MQITPVFIVGLIVTLGLQRLGVTAIGQRARQAWPNHVLTVVAHVHRVVLSRPPVFADRLVVHRDVAEDEDAAGIRGQGEHPIEVFDVAFDEDVDGLFTRFPRPALSTTGARRPYRISQPLPQPAGHRPRWVAASQRWHRHS